MDERIRRQPGAIQGMFARVARRYDLLNRLLSLGQDGRWRRHLLDSLVAAPPGPLLDLATGTGDVALGARGRVVVGADFCIDMLALGSVKGHRRHLPVRWVAGDAMRLPFRDDTFAAVSVAFGARNFSSLQLGLVEIRRVLLPGGLAAVLEFQQPPRAWQAALHRWWSWWVVEPMGGWLSDDGEAYTYLPASMADFPDRRGLATVMAGAGLTAVAGRQFALGVVGLSVGRKDEQS